MEPGYQKDIDLVQRIAAVPSILDVICRSTGMGFAAVARVTDDRWIACQVLDNVDFGLPAGGELKVETTLCHEVRQHQQVIAIDDVANDHVYCLHHTPRIYGLQSYISVPIMLPDGRFFGTLCAIHTKTAKVNNPQTIATFKLFAELIAYHLDASDKLDDAQLRLEDERETAKLREQFIAVLGHDLRNPIAGVDAGISRLMKDGWTEKSPQLLRMMKTSMARMAGLVDNVMDLARSRLGGGITLSVDGDRPITETLNQVIDEFRIAHPDRAIELVHKVERSNSVDHARLAQMFSNLLGNAISHGAADEPIVVEVASDEKHLTLTVANSGPPIPEDIRQRMFQPFQRGDGSHREGLGLGLYIASEIARAHGGSLDVSSDDQSTKFSFSMPGSWQQVG